MATGSDASVATLPVSVVPSSSTPKHAPLQASGPAAPGAGRSRIARELLMESVLLGLLGGVLGIGVAAAGLRLLVLSGPANLPRLNEISLDLRSLLFTCKYPPAEPVALRLLAPQR